MDFATPRMLAQQKRSGFSGAVKKDGGSCAVIRSRHQHVAIGGKLTSADRQAAEAALAGRRRVMEQRLLTGRLASAGDNIGGEPTAGAYVGTKPASLHWRRCWSFA